MYQEYFVRIFMCTIHWVLSELYKWLVWLFSIFLIAKIAPLIFSWFKLFQFLELIFRFLFIPRSIIHSYTISPRRCKRVATIEAYKATDCIFTAYMIDISVCYLFLIMREQIDVKDMVSFILFSQTNDWFMNFSSKISKFPPEGYILDGIMHGMLYISMTMVFTRAYFRLLLMKLKSYRSTKKKSVESIVTEMRPKQIYTSVYTSEQLENYLNRVDFDPMIKTAVVDNAANAHIWCVKEDFLPETLRPIPKHNAYVTTIGGSNHTPVAMGDVKTAWLDDNGRKHTHILKDALHFPQSPINIISVTALAEQFGDEEGTWACTKWKYTTFTWDEGKYVRTINHPSSLLPDMQLCDCNTSALATFFNHCKRNYCFRTQASRSLQKPLALSTTNNDDALISTTDGMGHVSTREIESKRKFTGKESKFRIGDRILYCRDNHVEAGIVQNIRLDKATLVPYFDIGFGGERKVTSTKEFIGHIDEPDPMTIPITDDQIKAFSKFLSPEALKQLSRKTVEDDLTQEFMHWHHKLNHLPYSDMFRLCERGMLPKRFLRLKKYPALPLCPSCLFGTVKKRAWRSKSKKDSKGKHIRRKDEDKPGDRVSVDQMVSRHPGLVPRITGRHTRDRITCVTVFKDHATDVSYSHLQTSTDMESTLQAKAAFEKWSLQHGVPIRNYHADNGRFAERGFRTAVSDANQGISFCAVGAHHQSGIIERHIGLLTASARTSLLHAQHLWPEAVSSILWPFAWLEAEYRYNHFRLDADGLSPLNRFSQTKEHLDINDLHPFGCPVFVLDHRGQNGSMIPKWEPRSRVGIYLGHSKDHAGNVALVLNPRTLHVSPQYHLIFDDTFSTVPYMRSGEVPPNWSELVKKSQESLLTDVDFDLASNFHLDEVDAATSEYVHPPPADITPSPPSISSSLKKSKVTFDSKVSTEKGAVEPLSSNKSQLIFPKSPSLDSLSLRRSPRIKALNERKRASTSALFSRYCLISYDILKEKRQPTSFLDKVVCHAELVRSNFDGTLNFVHPLNLMVFLTKKNSNNDTYTYSQMLKLDDRASFVEAMRKEVEDHEKRKHWTIVPRKNMPTNAKTILAIWSFKRKRLPDGSISKYKARLCAHGGMQRWGENYWETYAPVVNWISIRVLLILSLIFDLKTRSLDFVLAFPQAKLDVDIFMELPVGFETAEGNSKMFVLKLEKNLYGLKQAAYNWFELLKSGLEARGFKTCESDQCVFVRHDAMILTYVDDCIILCKEDSIADEIIRSLERGNENFDFTDDGDLERYLGMNLTREDGKINITQPHLINRIIEAVGFDASVNSKPVPAVKPLLHRDTDGPERKFNWSYRQLVGMLTYLMNSSRPELAMAVNQAARFCNDPKLSHERAIHRICKYLLGTRDKGIIFQPDKTKGIECFVDADFAGGWSKDDANSAENVMSRSGFIILFAGCPVYWRSTLQTEIALSTAESEYIALSSAMREVLPLMSLLQELHSVFKIPSFKPKFHCSVFEDNESCIAMANASKFTPRTKHISLKYHHFRSFVKKREITIHSINTKEQPADIFTKPLEESTFCYLRREISGW